MKVSIVGVTGYGGMELIRYINQHPYVEIASVHSRSIQEKQLTDTYPHLNQLLSLQLEEINTTKIMEQSELVFLTTPSGISKGIAPRFVAANFPVIDLSGDFRLKQPFSYEKWYGSEAASKEIVEKFDYGLAEMRKNPSSKWIANPGCYATAAELSFAPLLASQLVQTDSIIIDGKSGLSGAGKGLSEKSHFADAHDNMTLYKMNQHQHIPEILQLFQRIEPSVTAIQFSTSLIPISRGIFLTCYAKLKESIQVCEKSLVSLFKEYYQDAPFVRIQDQGNYPNLKQVIGSNFCDIGLTINRYTNTISIVTVIDNLGKGAAGQAIQNLNIFAGYSEKSGLETVPFYL